MKLPNGETPESFEKSEYLGIDWAIYGDVKFQGYKHLDAEECRIIRNVREASVMRVMMGSA